MASIIKAEDFYRLHRALSAIPQPKTITVSAELAEVYQKIELWGTHYCDQLEAEIRDREGV